MPESPDVYSDPEDPLVQLGQEELAQATPPDNPTDEPEATEEAEEVSAEAAEERRWAGRFTSPEELERGYTELEQRFGRQGNEMGQQMADMRAQMAMLQQQYQPPQQQPQTITTSDGQELPMLTKEQLAEFYEDDPVEAILYMSTLAGLNAVQPIAEKFNAQLTPLAKQSSDQQAQSVIAGLSSSLPDGMFDRNRDALAAALEADKQAGITYADQQQAYQRMRQIVITAEYDRGMVAQSTPTTGQPNGEVTRTKTVAVEGGSTPQPPAQAAAAPDPDFDWINEPAGEIGPFGRRRRAAIR